MPPVEFAENLAHEIDREASRAARDGKDVLALHIGDPDLETPKGIRDAAVRSIEQGRTHYAPTQGFLRLREALVEHWATPHQVPATPEQVVVLPTKFAIFAALASTIDTGDEVLFADPSYFFDEPVRLLGGVPVRFPLRPDHSLDLEALNAAVTPKTRVLVLVTPGNPTGRRLKADELRAAGEIVGSKRVTVVSDEAYSELVYEGSHVAAASAIAADVPVVTLGSFSKTYAMSGWRAGFAIAPKELAARMVQVAEHTITCVPPFIQDACRWALEHAGPDRERIRAELRARRDQLLGRLDDVPGVSYVHPDGAIYVFPRIALPTPSVDVARQLLAEEALAVAPGSAFGPHGEGHLRIAYTAPAERLDVAAARFSAFLQRHGATRG